MYRILPTNFNSTPKLAIFQKLLGCQGMFKGAKEVKGSHGELWEVKESSQPKVNFQP